MKYSIDNLKKIIIFLSLLICFLALCLQQNSGEWNISDLSKDTVLTARTWAISPTKLILQVSGYASDSIQIQHVKVAGGKIEEEMSFDQYSNSISVNLKRYKAKKGKLKIKYRIPGILF